MEDEKKCLVCNRNFMLKSKYRPNVTTCSPSCARTLSWENGSRPKGDITIINCLVCGREKEKLTSVKHDFKYCSRECMGKGKDLKISIKCSNCGIEFKKRRDKILDNNYCSAACVHESKMVPGSFWNDKDKIRQYHAVYSHHYRSVKKSGVRGEIGFKLKDWMSIIEDFGAKCMCCGSEESITIDHIISIHNGGINHKSNIQVLCKKCNSSKGIKEIDYRPEKMKAVHGIIIKEVK